MKSHASLVLLLVAAFGVSGCGQHPSDKTTATTEKGNNPAPPADTPLKLEGTWLGQTVEIDGQMIPEKDAHQFKITFTGDGHYTFALDEHQSNQGSFTVDQSAKPKAIDLKGEKIEAERAPGNTSLGILERTGDTLRICLNGPATTPRPTEFKSAKETFIITLKLKPTLTAAEMEDLICKQPIKQMNDLADALEKAPNEQEAIAKVREHERVLAAWVEKTQSLGISDKEANQLLDQHKTELEQAQKRLEAVDKKFPKAMDVYHEGPERKPDPLPPGWKEATVVKEWSGSVEDDNQRSKLPFQNVIIDAKTFGQLWEAIKPGEKAPELDFKKVFVVKSVTRTTKISATTQIREKGDMMMMFSQSGRDVPGFRYLVRAIDREGIQSVNFEPLK